MDFYRNIRTNIVFSKKYEGIKSIVFTSTQQKEGKSTVLSNLAKLFSNINKKVLVIDANSKKPSATTILGAEKVEGISESLNENEYFKYIQKTNIENLFLLTSGNGTSCDLISSIKIKDMIEKLKMEFDYIFIDTNSLDSSSDALILSNYCDGVIIICGCGEVDIDNVRVSKEKLESIGANILGVLLNKFEE